jgi:hypothetical protein
MSFGPLIDRLRDALDGDNENLQHPQQGQQPYGNVLPASQDPYGDPADQQGSNQPVGYQQGQFGNVLPASQDPLGDPADQEAGFGNVLPASQDPYGDPADQEGYQQGYNQPVGYQQGQFGNVLPASQDPLGDPADEQQRQQQEQGGLGGLLGHLFKRV